MNSNSLASTLFLINIIRNVILTRSQQALLIFLTPPPLTPETMKLNLNNACCALSRFCVDDDDWRLHVICVSTRVCITHVCVRVRVHVFCFFTFASRSHRRSRLPPARPTTERVY